MSTIPFISQLRFLWQFVTGDTKGAEQTQNEFLDAWEKHPVEQISQLADNIPVVGHIKGFVHLALGDTEAFAHSEEAATRTLAVLGAGALTAGTGGVAVPLLAGVVAGLTADAAITGIESARHQKYDPQGYLGAVSEFSSDWRGGLFDVIAIAVGDGVLGADGSITKTKYKTTKVFRVEGEGIFLTKRGMVQHGANSRIFPGPGGSVIESANILKLIVPPTEEEKPVSFKKPAVLCLNIGDVSRTESYYAQKLLQYREAVEKLRSDPDLPSTSHPAAFGFSIKSFRILTSDAERMFRDVPEDGHPSPSGVRRVDITKTQTSFECPQPVYTPLLEKAIPDTYKEAKPAWLIHLPNRLLEAIRDHQVAYGRVRTFVIVSSKFGKTSLHANIAQKITDNELKRLEHGPISLSILSEKGVDDIQVRDEPVRRLRQSREVKCGIKLTRDKDHGRHMEYLAEFSDGSTFWIPSLNVAEDLKEEFWNVIMTNAREVSQVVSSDAALGTITVKHTDGSTETVKQDQLFWQKEVAQTKLTDAEFEALLHHGHFGNDFTDFIPCTLTVNSDWARMTIMGNGTAVIKDPAAEKAGEYAGVRVDNRSIYLGEENSYRFVSRQIPFFIINNGASFDIQVAHGADAARRDDRNGNVVLKLLNEIHKSYIDQSNVEQNQSTFHIRPAFITPALLSVETDWGAIEITSNNATVSPDPTVDQNMYEKVAFTSKSVKLSTGIFGKKFVIPFLIMTQGENIDITITHGRDKSRYDDGFGTASALFAQNTYTSKCESRNIRDNPKSFMNCKVGVHPPSVPL